MYRKKVSRRRFAALVLVSIPSIKSQAVWWRQQPDPATLLLQDDDSERDVTTYTVLILEKNSVQIADLSPDTTYVVRVQVVGPEVTSGSHSVEHVFHTSPLGTTIKAMGFFFFHFWFSSLNVLK